MITGKVLARLRPALTVTIRNDAGETRTIEAIIDTGYNGEFVLPPQVIQSLGLAPAGDSAAVLADGTIVRLPMFKGWVSWNGQWRHATFDEADSDPLVGMSFLKQFRLTIDCVVDGTVTIVPLP